MLATGKKDEAFKVVCDQHGVINAEAPDRTVAELFEADHNSDCPGETRIFSPTETPPELTPASGFVDRPEESPGDNAQLVEFCGACDNDPAVGCSVCGRAA